MRRLIAIFFLINPLTAVAQDQYLIDWDEVGEEAINHLIDLVRLDTTNPPGNETLAANYVRDALAADGAVRAP